MLDGAFFYEVDTSAHATRLRWVLGAGALAFPVFLPIILTR